MTTMTYIPPAAKLLTVHYFIIIAIITIIIIINYSLSDITEYLRICPLAQGLLQCRSLNPTFHTVSEMLILNSILFAIYSFYFSAVALGLISNSKICSPLCLCPLPHYPIAPTYQLHLNPFPT